MKTIKLTRNKVAVVDDSDADRVRELKWSYLENGRGQECAVHWLRSGALVHYIPLANFVLGVDGIVDHRNGDRLDNRKKNLRPCSLAQNNKNKAAHKRRTHTQLAKYKGVYYRPSDGSGHKRQKPYFAQIRNDGKYYSGGYHSTPEDAALAYNTLALKHHGEFARLNVIRK